MKGEICWRCGKKNKIERHHAIPKSMSPLKNKIIPLCKKCHGSIHNGNNGLVNKMSREVLYFNKVKQSDGSYKLQGSISNGKICFVDRSVSISIKPLIKYDCLIKEIDKVAFARDFHPVESISDKIGMLERLKLKFKKSKLSK